MVPREIVQGRAILPRKVEHVGKPVRGDEHHACPRSFEQHVGRDSGAMHESRDRRTVDERQARFDTAALVVRGTEDLVRRDGAIGVNGNEIREGTADVDANGECAHADGSVEDSAAADVTAARKRGLSENTSNL
jgi:hypothetical protein